MRSSAVPTVVNAQEPAASPVKVSNRLWYFVSVGLVEGVSESCATLKDISYLCEMVIKVMPRSLAC